MNIRPAILTDAPLIADFNIRLAQESEQLRLDPKCVSAGVAALLTDPAKGVYFLADGGVCLPSRQLRDGPEETQDLGAEALRRDSGTSRSPVRERGDAA